MDGGFGLIPSSVGRRWPSRCRRLAGTARGDQGRSDTQVREKKGWAWWAGSQALCTWASAQWPFSFFHFISLLFFFQRGIAIFGAIK
jgi:hypothetical protein